jgi:protein TonB
MLSRSFKISLLLSLLVHAGGFVALSYEPIARKVQAAPAPMLARKSEPKVVRFELVDTPSSAETPEAPKKSALVSNKNTRAQDAFKGETPLANAPHMEGKHEESKDTRPKGVVTAPPQESPPKPKPREQTQPEKETPSEEKPVTPEPDEPQIIQLAKKAPEPSKLAEEAATPSAPSRIVSMASAKNIGADAEITGELSYAASRYFFGEYLLKMKQAVEQQWISRLVSNYSGIVNSQAVLTFKIQPDGQVTDLTVRSSEGDPYFPVVCASSVQAAQPFDKIPYEQAPGLPAEHMNKPLKIQFTFNYN